MPADSKDLHSQPSRHDPAADRFGDSKDETNGNNGRGKRPVPVEEEFVNEEDPFDGWDEEEEEAGRVLEGGSFELREPSPAPPAPRSREPAAKGSKVKGRSSSKSDKRRSSSMSAEKRPPSKAAEHRPPRRVADEFGNIDLGEDTDLEEATAEEIQRETERWAPKTVRDTVADTVDKICRVCGKNLKGHRRYKDERGYICVGCDRDERARRIPCAECGKPVPPEALRPWGPIAICARCWADHESDPKLRIRRKVSSRPWEELEKKTVLAIAAIVLVGFLILALLTWL